MINQVTNVQLVVNQLMLRRLPLVVMLITPGIAVGVWVGSIGVMAAVGKSLPLALALAIAAAGVAIVPGVWWLARLAMRPEARRIMTKGLLHERVAADRALLALGQQPAWFNASMAAKGGALALGEHHLVVVSGNLHEGTQALRTAVLARQQVAGAFAVTPALPGHLRPGAGIQPGEWAHKMAARSAHFEGVGLRIVTNTAPAELFLQMDERLATAWASLIQDWRAGTVSAPAKSTVYPTLPLSGIN